MKKVDLVGWVIPLLLGGFAASLRLSTLPMVLGGLLGWAIFFLVKQKLLEERQAILDRLNELEATVRFASTRTPEEWEKRNEFLEKVEEEIRSEERKKK